MKIKLDKLELVDRINALALKKNYLADFCDELYFDTELGFFFVLLPEAEGSKYSGKIMIPVNSVAAAQVARISIPKHQPIGTPEDRDTPSGHRKPRSTKTAKSAIAEKMEARKASKK